jgi:predicted cobalt transporter CbtA
MVIAGFITSIAAVVVAIVAAVFTGIQAVETKRARRAAELQAAAARHANEIANRALQEAAMANAIADKGRHRQMRPAVTVELGREVTGGGYELVFISLNDDIESGTVSLLDGWQSAIAGISSSTSSPNIGALAELPATPAGVPATLGIWLHQPENAYGKEIKMRCIVTTADGTWKLPAHSVRFQHPPASPRVARLDDEPSIGSVGF